MLYSIAFDEIKLIFYAESSVFLSIIKLIGKKITPKTSCVEFFFHVWSDVGITIGNLAMVVSSLPHSNLRSNPCWQLCLDLELDCISAYFWMHICKVNYFFFTITFFSIDKNMASLHQMCARIVPIWFVLCTHLDTLFTHFGSFWILKIQCVKNP